MSRTAAVAAAMVLLFAGCASEPAAAPPTPDATTAAVDASTTTSFTEDETPESTTTTEPTTNTTTVPLCELGEALDAVWLVDTGNGHGTAFHIGDGEWITAAHVIGDVDRVVFRHGSDEIKASVVGVDHDTDVALLEAATESVAVLLAQDAPEVGSGVLAAGFPLYGESEPSVSRGVISRLERDLFLGELLLTDTAMNPGNSGGPLFTECGTVAGMVVQKIVDVDVEGIGYAVTASELLSQLPRLRSGYRTATVTDVVQPVEPIPDAMAWQLDSDPLVAWVQAEWWYGPETSAVNPPEIWVSCDRLWSVYWPDAYIYAPPAPDSPIPNPITTEWQIDDIDRGYGSFSHYSDRVIAAGGWSDDLDAAARTYGASEVMIEAWNGYVQDQNLIGAAAFPLDGYAEAIAVLQRECP